MKHEAMKLREAFDFVRSKRWLVRPNIGFFQQLIGNIRKLSTKFYFNFHYIFPCDIFQFDLIEKSKDYEMRLFELNTVKMVRHESGDYVPDFVLESKLVDRFLYLSIKK